MKRKLSHFGRALIYAALSTFAVLSVGGEAWFRPSGYSQLLVRGSSLSTDLVYLVFTSWYVLESYFFLKYRDYEKDAGEALMGLHHLATLSLVSLSWYYEFTRVGTRIMFLHSISDVTLELALEKFKRPQRPLLYTLALSNWFYHRNVDFTFWVIPSCLEEISRYDYQTRGGDRVRAAILVTSLGILSMLHYIWFGVFLYKIFEKPRPRKEKVHPILEDSHAPFASG